MTMWESYLKTQRVKLQVLMGGLMDQCLGIDLHPQGCSGKIPACLLFVKCGQQTVYSTQWKCWTIVVSVLENPLAGQTRLSTEKPRI